MPLSGLASLKLALFTLGLMPGAYLLWQVNSGLLANPVEYIQRFSGTWTFNFLLLTLLVTPLRHLTEWHWLIRIRRMLGLFCFAYATVHALAFFGLDHEFDPRSVILDILKRPFITVGFVAFLLLVPLAATSNQWAIRHLGGRRWQELHRSVYAIAILATVHYFWLVKASALVWPMLYGILVVILLGWRAQKWWQKANAFRPRMAGAPIKFFPKPPQQGD